MPSLAQLQNKQEADPNYYGKVLHLGPSGSGKDYAAASLPGPIYVYDFDQRVEGMLDAVRTFPELAKNISFDRYNPQDAYESFQQKLSIQIIESKSGGNRTLCMDSIGSMLICFLLESQKLRLAANPGSGKKRGGLQFITPDDYNYSTLCFQQTIVNGIRQFPGNVVLTGWIVNKYGKEVKTNDKGQEVEDTYGESVIIGDKLVATDKLAELIPGFFNEVYVFGKKRGMNGKDMHFVNFRGGAARTAFSQLPSGDIDITGKNYFKVWSGYIKGSK